MPSRIKVLSVIIILGILMIIAIPAVTSYISDSRNSAYVSTAKEIVSGTINLVNEGKLGMYDTNITYYIPASCINTENNFESPYGTFVKAYVGVNFDGDGYFIAGEHQNNDIYYGVWVGDEIKNISFKKGIFEYSLLGKANLENENAHNVYFWTYELGNSNELFSHILKNESNETSNNKLVCYAKDVKKLLGIKSKYEIDLRIGLYILITLLLLAITVFVYIVTFKVNGKESAIVKKVLLWLITFVLSAIVAFLIINFAYNPRLVYGECKGIGEIFYNITGHCFPNPAQCM